MLFKKIPLPLLRYKYNQLIISKLIAIFNNFIIQNTVEATTPERSNSNESNLKIKVMQTKSSKNEVYPTIILS